MNKLIQNTGFSHIVEYIFTLVDEETLDLCNLVCKSWNDFIENSKFLWTTRLRRYLSKQIRIREFGQVRCCEFVEAYPNWARGCSCSEATEFDERLNVLDLKKMYILMKMYCSNTDGKEYEVGESPLHYAVKIGRSDIVESLSKTSLDFNAAIELYLVTPFHIACCEGHLEIVLLLLQKESINLNARNFLGMTPFLWACLNGRTEIVNLLLKVALMKGININDPDNAGMTPLHWACSKGHNFTVDLLLRDSGIDINAKDRSGSTALHYAGINGHLKTVELFHNKE